MDLLNPADIGTAKRTIKGKYRRFSKENIVRWLDKWVLKAICWIALYNLAIIGFLHLMPGSTPDFELAIVVIVVSGLVIKVNVK